MKRSQPMVRVRRDRKASPGGPKHVRVWLLGGFGVSVGSWTIGENEWRLRKARNLVKLLALAPGHRLQREQVYVLLWPESNQEAAANNLRHTLHVARRVFEPSGATSSRYLRLGNGELAL